MTKKFNTRLADIIRKPLITEKATNALDLNQYTFEVDHRAAKPDIKAAVESMFNVKVIGVNTMNPPRRTRRVGKFAGKRSQIKKAIVRLAEGDKIQLFPES
ncbi:MAG: 50S ribosomal protein L23 [Prochlorococcus sp. SP3034]|nr:50S ribosomal protein L23 [Prochlorococcus sp. SP3034]|tara:strand:+ start:1715 stop:2017 length:303 start_codon:yes stop_codon:yes gene_type:complete